MRLNPPAGPLPAEGPPNVDLLLATTSIEPENVAVLEGVRDEVRRNADPTFRLRPLPPAPPAS